MSSTELLERPTTTGSTNPGKMSHIVVEGFWKLDGETGERTGEFLAETPVVDGMVFGLPVKALCGYEWVPGEDPQRYPLCSLCVEVAKERGWAVPAA